MKYFYFLLFLFLIISNTIGQNIELYSQFNGRYDYTALGKTLNLCENNLCSDLNNCQIITTPTSANLTLTSGQNVAAAYLYWAGSGTGDLNITLDNTAITPDRTFSYTLVANVQTPSGSVVTVNQDFFAAFKDVTSIVSAKGSGTYTVSDIDLLNTVQDQSQYFFCGNRTNFGGWSIIVIHEDSTLPLNQVNVYDGFQGVGSNNNNLAVQLNNISVIDDEGAKIGFLAWEGDEDLDVTEELRINGNVISNALNPADNQFNGTNSFTGDTDFYNMDLDFYDIENNINIGDTSALIELTSGQDLIMINNIVTVFNSTLPEPAPNIDNINSSCNSRDIIVDYTVTNNNSTADLPANTNIIFFADNQLVGQTATNNIIPIGGSETGQITITIPTNVANDFALTMTVNEDASGNTIIQEIDPDNNEVSESVNIIDPVIANPPIDIEECDEISNNQVASFDLTINTSLVAGNQNNVTVSYHDSLNDAENGSPVISTPDNYNNGPNHEEIFIRVTSNQDPDCYETTSFFINVNYLPVIGNPDDLILCDDFSNDELAVFDLTENSSLLLNNQPNSSLSYHLTSSDANQNSNAITSNFENTSNPQTIYTRLENVNHPECYTTTSFSITVNAINNIPLNEALIYCDEGFNLATFDLTEIEESLALSNSETIENYYTTASDASFLNNAITTPANYTSINDPQTIFIRVEQQDACYKIYEFTIKVENCPPFIPEGFSPNNDGVNDTFEISGLYEIFENFDLKIYNRFGSLIYKGNNNIPEWDGTSNKGLNNCGKELPSGTYYYVLNLNDANYNSYKGWVYLNR
ncbi:gliding motility-associated C-terminal domain-containing protein [Mesonia aestuariivivens]|uniref:Gliding motility-associated C-terminal domain-containing protein n=1 Tax=Mesonia aestuariivivens TaxID=2796128 RepID=A0ABS6W0I9_9FLAO|nr:gliding motility-associated C-terminal domain-containing protein [Mesonia aestuariivivens]MBW2961373.1 gliding motility-associated C-terminal domain-containing protein [Mesonia aestuariivivens]